MSESLTSKQVKYLRGLAHDLEPVVQVGGKGVTAEVLRAVIAALDSHELIKVRMREPEDKKTMARELADRSDAVLCGLVGHTVILYRRHPEDPKIHVPAPRSS